MKSRSEFHQRLKLLYNIVSKGANITIHEAAEESFPDSLPEFLPDAMQDFYTVFGRERAFLNGIFHILLPNELTVENGLLIFAVEQQGVCAYGVETATGTVNYLDLSNHISEKVSCDLQDFLLYLIGLQSTEHFSCVCRMEHTQFDTAKQTMYKLSDRDGKYAVFCDGKSVIAVCEAQAVYLTAIDDESMESFGKKHNLVPDYL